MRARDAGFEVVYQGIRLTPEQIVAAAVAEDVHCVGLSILSGSHMELVPAVLDGLRAQGLDDLPVVVGGIIPSADAARLRDLGVAAVFTPKDFGLTEIMAGIVRPRSRSATRDLRLTRQRADALEDWPGSRSRRRTDRTPSGKCLIAMRPDRRATQWVDGASRATPRGW